MINSSVLTVEKQGIYNTIVLMVCDGKSLKQVQFELGMSAYQVGTMFRDIRNWAFLPGRADEFPAKKEEIKENLTCWRTYEALRRQSEADYFNSLVKLNEK